MENFNFCVGTRILFGKGQEEKLPELLRPYGNKVLLTYGGGSIKRTGLYDRIKNLLHECEIDVYKRQKKGCGMEYIPVL